MSKILILSHASPITGPIDRYEDFLLSKNNDVAKLAHPLDNYSGRDTKKYQNKKEESAVRRINLGLINLLIDFFISLKFISSEKGDVAIGANNFDTLPAILARSVLKKPIKQIIYFGTDFSEHRFNNSVLDAIYTQIEKWAIKHADIVVSNTKRAEHKRVTLGLDSRKSIVIPNGVKLQKPVFLNKEIAKDKFVYVGTVNREHGLLEFLQSCTQLVNELTILGGGSDLQNVLDFCKEKGIAYELHENVSHEYVIEFLQNFEGIGVAPYNLSAKYIFYASPMKINEYICCGVPVITSETTEIAESLTSMQLGACYDKLEESKVNKAINALDLKSYYVKAKDYYSKFNSDELYQQIPLIAGR